MVPGTKYAVTVNPIVPATVHNLISFDAVITDTTTPSIIPYRRPTTRQSNNGTIVKNGDGSFTVSVATFNNTFGLLTIADDCNDGGAHVTDRTPYAWNVGGNASRIDGLTVKIDSAVSGMGKYVFSATEYANFMNVGAQSWPVTLEVSFQRNHHSVSGITGQLVSQSPGLLAHLVVLARWALLINRKGKS